MGKHKPIYDPAGNWEFSKRPSNYNALMFFLLADCGDYVVVINAKDIAVTGKKWDQKLYRHHTGFPGGLKEIPMSRIMERNPERVIHKAVSGMLPKNRLREKRMERLHIFDGPDHPYAENIIKRYDEPQQEHQQQQQS